MTGASGYLGGLIATALLAAEPEVRILAPIRPGHDPDALRLSLAEELAAGGDLAPAATLDRLEFATLPPAGSILELTRQSLDFGVDEIVHCAACLDYFDKAGLEAINVGMTQEMLALGSSIGVRRFTYISTAFSSGYVRHPIAETVHDDPEVDPTDYTSTKRRAERSVAESGLPYLILRPSIIIGHSGDGRYSGKRYGLYQLWSGIERLLCREWHETIHAFAPLQPANLVHQDAFQNAFIAARRQLPDDRILNIVAAEEGAPSARDLWTLWLDACNRPLRRIYYERMADIPSRELPPAQRALLALASVNLEIIGHPWHFERDGLAALTAKGLHFPEARLPSIERCQRRLMENSAAIQKFLERHQRQFALAS
ncbi:MAG TPA: SDR family oxidoreductase [Allosphingosinicella sp.]|nr:SDR family oxidoreductase [Allosphingosinicella sp.]